MNNQKVIYLNNFTFSNHKSQAADYYHNLCLSKNIYKLWFSSNLHFKISSSRKVEREEIERDKKFWSRKIRLATRPRKIKDVYLWVLVCIHVNNLSWELLLNPVAGVIESSSTNIDLCALDEQKLRCHLIGPVWI